MPGSMRRREYRPARGDRGQPGLLNHVTHAEEGLELVGGSVESLRFGGGDRVCQAADVVAAEGRTQSVVVLQQKPGAALEGGVALPFLKVDRLGPAQPPCSRPRSPNRPP